ncbi:hypothetical protein [Streptosporangium sp. NPDC002524]|uniref:hypothetical protein n=1 Tax=Streptosporangium sp. NPDC002524 TaxID=3154537 RepID=UPI003322FBD7
MFISACIHHSGLPRGKSRKGKMRTICLLAGFCISLMVAASLGTVGAQADPTDPHPKTLIVGSPQPIQKIMVRGTGSAPDLDDATQRDLETYAKATGKAIEKLKQKYRGRGEFNSLVDQLAADATLGYVQAGYVAEDSAADGAEVWIRFTNKPSQAVLRQLEQLPYAVRVEFGAPLARQDLEKIQEARRFKRPCSRPLPPV